MKILQDLYCGNVNPHEHHIKAGSEYEKLLRYIIRHEDELESTFTEEQKEIFEKYKDCKTEIELMNESEAFISGFKLAARIVLEVMDGTDVPSIDD